MSEMLQAIPVVKKGKGTQYRVYGQTHPGILIGKDGVTAIDSGDPEIKPLFRIRVAGRYELFTRWVPFRRIVAPLSGDATLDKRRALWAHPPGLWPLLDSKTGAEWPI